MQDGPALRSSLCVYSFAFFTILLMVLHQSEYRRGSKGVHAKHAKEEKSKATLCVVYYMQFPQYRAVYLPAKAEKLPLAVNERLNKIMHPEQSKTVLILG